MSKAHIRAEEFGPTASYGYGVAVDTMDGHRILRHTGGMVSFMSALQVDLDEGVAAWASINAMQGYRPNPVAAYALKLLRASRERKPLPEMPKPNPAERFENAADYAGIYTAPDGSKLEFNAEGERLFLASGGRRLAVQSAGGDTGLVPSDGWELFPFVFSRKKEKAKRRDGAASAMSRPPVIEVAHGPRWFSGAAYDGPKTFAAAPKEWGALIGHYHNDSPWAESFRVVERKGRLWVDGVTPLAPRADGVFALEDGEGESEWLAFSDIANGKARKCKLSGLDFWRVDAE